MSRLNFQIRTTLISLLATGLGVSALAQSTAYPKYQVGETRMGRMGLTIHRTWLIRGL